MEINPIIENVNFEHSTNDEKLFNIGGDSHQYLSVTWNGPIESNKSFSGELEFNISDSAPPHCMLITCRDDSVYFGGWNIQIVNGKLRVQIGNGQTWLGVGDSMVTPNTWHKISWQLNNTTKIAEIHLDGVKSEITMSSNYVHASNTVYIGTLNQNNQFRFAGKIKNIKLGSGLVIPTPTVNPNTSPDGTNYDSISDTPVSITDFDVSNFINVIDQYSSDRVWIQQALVRLREELREEMDLNQKLKDLNTADAIFLVTKVEQFMSEYSSEIVSAESELQQIFAQLQTILTENEQLMNSNKALKDRLSQLNSNGIDNSIVNIRKLINDNVQLLQSAGRWGDTADSAYTFFKKR